MLFGVSAKTDEASKRTVFKSSARDQCVGQRFQLLMTSWSATRQKEEEHAPESRLARAVELSRRRRSPSRMRRERDPLIGRADAASKDRGIEKRRATDQQRSSQPGVQTTMRSARASIGVNWLSALMWRANVGQMRRSRQNTGRTVGGGHVEAASERGVASIERRPRLDATRRLASSRSNTSSNAAQKTQTDVPAQSTFRSPLWWQRRA